MGREKTAKNQALTSAPVFWQNRACITAEQGLQRRRGGCQLSGTGKSRRQKQAMLLGGRPPRVDRPTFVIPNRPLPHSLLAPSGLRQIRLASTCVTCARTDTIAVNLF